MARLTPRDVRIGTMAGGGLIGAVLSGAGTFGLLGSFSSGGYEWQDALTGALLLGIGAAFVLVSVIVLPALHASRVETLAVK